MATGYGQRCPVARALDVIGERWSLLILRDLKRKGPLRFQTLEQGLPGVAPNTLSARLKLLEAQGVIATRLYEQHPPRYEYYLTDKGIGARSRAEGALRLGRALRLIAWAGPQRASHLRIKRAALSSSADLTKSSFSDQRELC